MNNIKYFFFISAVLFLSNCSTLEKIEITPDIILEPLNDTVWIHITYTDYPGYGRISANGLIIKENDHAVLIDTPWNDEQSEILYKWVEENWNISIKKVIACHFHVDNLGGLAYLQSQGVDSYAFSRTVNICMQKGLPVPENSFGTEFVLSYKPVKIEAYFPGEGHTADSICVYLPDYKILFGGCSVKSLESTNLGNISDANLEAWPDSLRNLKNRFSDAEIVVPGHGKAGDLSLIDHTLTLF